MLKFPVSEPKRTDLAGRMHKLRLVECEIEETYFRASGPGGQKTNKTLSGVNLLHRPTGIRVRCQRERSQGINRFLARRLLVEELEARQNGKTRHIVKAERLHEEKERRERRRGSRERGKPSALPAAAPDALPTAAVDASPASVFDLARAMNAYYLRPLPIFGSPSAS